MEKKPEQQQPETIKPQPAADHKEKKINLEGLPMEDSPYLQSETLEDYKLQAYGTGGHQEPTAGRGAGSTDAPTPSGAADPPSKADHVSATNVISRQGVP